METNDFSTIQMLREGRPEAFQYLFDHHYQVLCHVASQYLKDDFLAETIVSDVIFHMWKIHSKLRIDSSIRQYMTKSVRNRCINFLNTSYNRNEGSRNASSISDLPVAIYLRNDDYPLGRLLEEELEKVIEDSISKLPDQCRRVFCMSRFEDKTYQQIADELSMSVNTVKFHMKNAMSLLRKDLSRYLTTLFLLYMNNSNM